MTSRAIIAISAVSSLGWAAAAAAQSPVPVAPPADFAAAAAACVEAVSPDKLDTGKLEARGWTKRGDERPPFGQAAVFMHPGSIAQIHASPTPSGYCIVDAYAADFGQFELYQSAIADRLKANYGTTGLSNVVIGKPGSADRRQGFVIGNAVAGYSAAMRPGGLNLRFTAINVKFAGSAELFQTSRPPLSEAEIAENRANDFKDLTFARGNGTSQDLVANVRACAAALRNNAALPADDGWDKSIHASGTPRSVEAIKTRDFRAMLAAMTNTRQLLYRRGSHRGLVTKYFVRGVHTVCEATVFVDPASIAAIKAEAITALGLGKDGDPSGKLREFANEYMLADLTRSWTWEKSELAMRLAHGTSVDSPDQGKATISVFVF